MYCYAVGVVGCLCCYFTCIYHLLICDLVVGWEKHQPSGMKIGASDI